jgi:carbamoyl-phosphate synthase large subunit
MKRIVVTGCGGPAGVNFVRSLRIAKEKFFIVGTDINKYHLQLPDVDERVLVPRCTDPDYVDALNEIIRKFGIEFVHPQPDVEVKVISENREKINALTFLPDKKTIRICQDKLESAKIWLKRGIECPKSMLIENEDDLVKASEELGFPFWLRATRGAGGRGSTPVNNVEQGLAWIKYWRKRGVNWEFVAQEYLPGKNIAFQSIWKDGEIITSQARERIEYIYPQLAPSGITGTPSVAVTIHRDDVNKIATECVLAIDPNATGIFCVDLKENKNGVPCPTEINAGRFFTTSFFFSHAGINMPYYYVKLAYKEKIPELPKYNALPAGLYWIRHMDSGPILLNESEFKFEVAKPKIKLIVFDFDGTLVDLPIDYSSLRAELRKFFQSFEITSSFRPLLQSIEQCSNNVKQNFGEEEGMKVYEMSYKILEKFELMGSEKAELLPNVKNVLEKLKNNNIKLAIFSRTGRKCILNGLNKFGLEKYFDLIVSRDDVKKVKPDTEGLKKIMAHFNLRPEEILFVGDDVLDLMAGREANVKTIIIQPKGEPKEVEAPTIKDHREIFNFLA